LRVHFFISWGPGYDISIDAALRPPILIAGGTEATNIWWKSMVRDIAPEPD
jgi:hypothetical protein